MKKIAFTVLSFLLAFHLYCQKNDLPLHDKKFSHQIEQELKDGKISDSKAAYYYTYIGGYQKALEHYELPLDWGLDSITKKDSIGFLNYHPVNAVTYLAERIKNEQLVIISEAHQKPQHRVFTAELLAVLYKNGFRYLGLETITPSYGDSTKFLMDTLLHERGYPLHSPLTGMYTRETQMGNLVRTAINLGFEIFGYEKTTKKTERDLQQAMNIERFMKKDPKGKVVVHCGWYHAIESDFPKRKSDNYLAYHLKKRTGIDPLTIYQDALSEKIILPESPFYQLINADQVSVLMDEHENVFNGVDEKKHFDILIYHPRTTYIKNRPDWLANREGVQFVKINKNKIAKAYFPVLVEVFPLGEEHSVPVDVVELSSENDVTELLLQKGSYIVRVTDQDNTIKAYSITVK
ncbi:MAG: hypothetical protein AAFZ15_07595 [Bacteroidota bacterium]